MAASDAAAERATKVAAKESDETAEELEVSKTQLAAGRRKRNRSGFAPGRSANDSGVVDGRQLAP